VRIEGEKRGSLLFHVYAYWGGGTVREGKNTKNKTCISIDTQMKDKCKSDQPSLEQQGISKKSLGHRIKKRKGEKRQKEP